MTLIVFCGHHKSVFDELKIEIIVNDLIFSSNDNGPTLFFLNCVMLALKTACALRGIVRVDTNQKRLYVHPKFLDFIRKVNLNTYFLVRW